MKTSLLIAYIVILYQISFSQSPYTNIMIGSFASPEEPSICINPKNTNQIVAGANIDNYYYSTNAGLTWQNGTLTSSYGVWGDPCIIVDTNQHFYFFHLSYGQPPNGYWIDRIVCQKSTNAGVTWSQPGSYLYYNPPTDQQDKEWAAVDFSNGPRGNWIYSTWTEFDDYGSELGTDSSRILFARSTDGGLTWAGVQRINKLNGNCIDEDYTVEGAVPAVGPNGEVYVAWSGPQGINNFKIFFDKSTDGGNSWLANDIVIASQPGGWDLGAGTAGGTGILGINRCNGLPITCCDVSNSPYRDYVYVNWVDSVGTRDRDVKVARSTDGGNTWSAPIRVNNDAAGKEQFLTWMTVDRVTGHIYIVFYDRRNYSDNQTDVFLARSTNGGATWINERISTSPFIPASQYFFGDYSNITAHNGKVRAIWTRLVSGVLSIWTAITDYPIGIQQTSTEIPSSFALYQNYPNPFNPVTKFKFDIPSGNNGQQVQIKVYDLLGKEAAEIVNDKLQPGTYEYEWDASHLSSGVYFYKLTSDNFVATKKLVLNK